MIDLLGDEVPTISRSLLDPMHGFTDFWKAQPIGYKIARPQCEKKWVKYDCAKDSLHILMHMEHLKTTPKYLAGYIPYPETYLNRQDWKEWEPPAPKPAQKTWLDEYSEHEKHCTKPSAEIRAKMAQLRK